MAGGTRLPRDCRAQRLAGQQSQLDMQAVLADGTAEALFGLRIRYWTVFLCSVSRSAAAL
jgi:hypothetical protein